MNNARFVDFTLKCEHIWCIPPKCAHNSSGVDWKVYAFQVFVCVFYHYMPQYIHHYTHQLSMKKLMFFRCLWVFWATEYRALLSVVVIFYASSPANTPHTPIIIIPVFILTRSRIKDECSTIDQKILMILRQTRHTHTHQSSSTSLSSFL